MSAKKKTTKKATKKAAKKAAKKYAKESSEGGMMKEDCGSCKFFKSKGDPVGKCQRNPPPFVSTSILNWCGEFAPA